MWQQCARWLENKIVSSLLDQGGSIPPPNQSITTYNIFRIKLKGGGGGAIRNPENLQVQL